MDGMGNWLHLFRGWNNPQLEYQDGAKHLAERLKSIHDREGGAVNGGVEGVVMKHKWYVSHTIHGTGIFTYIGLIFYGKCR